MGDKHNTTLPKQADKETDSEAEEASGATSVAAEEAILEVGDQGVVSEEAEEAPGDLEVEVHLEVVAEISSNKKRDFS